MTGTKDSRGSGDVERPGVERRGVRASDAEREAVARRVREAAEVGRLGLDEIDERLDLVYAARYRHELAEATADLPEEQVQGSGVPADRRAAWRDGREGRGAGGGWRGPVLAGPLAIHAVVVAAMSVMVISRWIASGDPRFWPVFPIFWLVTSLVVHARIRARRLGRTPTA